MQKILSLITDTIHSLYGVDFSPEISVAPKPELGEYCINVFPLAKTAGKAPNILSEEIAIALAKHSDTFVSTNATGGYVNFFLTNSIWLNLFSELTQMRAENGEFEGDKLSESDENSKKKGEANEFLSPSGAFGTFQS
jgi:arginyl-tRNA synthetase